VPAPITAASISPSAVPAATLQNQPPQLTAIVAQAVAEGRTPMLIIAAKDPDLADACGTQVV
jgi:hypothetical protein